MTLKFCLLTWHKFIYVNFYRRIFPRERSALLVNLFQLLVILYCKLVLAELSRAWNTMGKKIWSPRHPRDFGGHNDRTSAYLSVHPTGFVVVQNNGKKVCRTCKFVFFLLRFIDFVAILIAFAVYHMTRFFIFFFFIEVSS